MMADRMKAEKGFHVQGAVHTEVYTGKEIYTSRGSYTDTKLGGHKARQFQH
jgi:hypothetical protein